MVYLVKTLIGVFALDEKRKVVSFKPFPRDPIQIATKLNEKEPTEMQEIKNELGSVKFSYDREIESYVKSNLRKYAMEYKFAKDQIEFNGLLTKINVELTKQKIKQSISRDNLIIHANNAIDELDKAINILIERIREWYSLHFPEMDRIIENHQMFVKLVEKFGDRKNFDDKQLNQFKENSSGIEFDDDDIKIIKLFASDITKLYDLRDSMSNYLSTLLKEISPNFSTLAGDIIAAKLISKAGGLERLSRMPSSTVQLLGSEKALFRFLKSKGKSKSPKFGLIYNHPLIQNAPIKKQGKIARLLASKLSIAARIDYYSKEYKVAEMKKELESKVKEILSQKE